MTLSTFKCTIKLSVVKWVVTVHIEKRFPIKINLKTFFDQLSWK